MDADGYVRITGRIKEMFIVGGFNCYPAEIEISLCGMPGHCPRGGDRRAGRAPGRGRPGLSRAGRRRRELDEAAVIEWAEDNMANYKVPRSVRFLDALPMNAGGKVLKTELRQLAAGETP